MFCGLPAIVSANAGVAERYPTNLQSLLLPDPEDVADLASRLAAWRTDMKQFRELVGSAGDQRRLRTWDQMAKEMIEVVLPPTERLF
jgi:hypothetical protein